MAATHKSAGNQNRAKLHDSFLEQFSDTVTSETGQFTQQLAENARDAVLGDFEDFPSPDGHAQQEAAPRKTERAPSMQLFNFKEHQELMSVNEEIRQLITQIRREILALEREHKGMLSDAARITVESLPQKPGIYHIRFLEWIIRTLRDIRIKVTDSAACFSMVMGKRAKMGYWGMFKKHGTSFGMSNERAIATQAG